MNPRALMKTREASEKSEKKKKKIYNMNMENRSVASRFVHLMEFLNSLNEGDFTGYVKINYSQGSIARVEKFEEVLKKK